MRLFINVIKENWRWYPIKQADGTGEGEHLFSVLQVK
jgi:hypothetical protein